MCGRYVLDVPVARLLEEFEIEYNRENFAGLRPRYNIAPSQTVPAVRHQDGKRTACLFRWGLVPRWAPGLMFGFKTINARADTVAEKPSFKSAFRSRRCLIPATGWYEWKQVEDGKQPFHIHLKSNRLVAFAGLWEAWTDKSTGEEIETCTIITTDAAPALLKVHDRMPVVLNPSDYDLWLSTEVTDKSQLQPLLVPYQGDDLTCYAVSRAVNTARSDNPSLIVPLH